MKLEGIENLRDLGGMTTEDGRRIKPCRLIRSDALWQMTENDAAYLKSLGVNKVIDLRSFKERSEKPDVETAGIENVHIPVFSASVLGISRDDRSMQEMDKTMWHDMTYLYRSMVEHSMAVSQLGKILTEIIAHDEGAILWHCSAGKDRCGFTSALCLHILGVDREQIMVDYLKTNEIAVPFSKFIYNKILSEGGSAERAEFMEKIFIADRAYLEAAYIAAEKLYGSIDGFITGGLGITERQKEHFRESCLE